MLLLPHSIIGISKYESISYNPRKMHRFEVFGYGKKISVEFEELSNVAQYNSVQIQRIEFGWVFTELPN